MDLPQLDELRGLRAQAEAVNASLLSDLRPFLHQQNGLTFRRLPTDSSNEKLNVTSTCTALMTLAVSYQLGHFYNTSAYAERATSAFRTIVGHPWRSSGLAEKNAFTSSLVLRAAGVLASHDVAAREDLLSLSHDGQTLGEIALEIGSGIPNKLQVQNYPPTPTIAFWFVDGIHNLGLQLPPEEWEKLAAWTNLEFSRQISLLSAPNEAMMDPISMAMAACLAARLRRIATERGFAARDAVLESLPSEVEMVSAVQRLFEYQGPSGIWPKYFPLFHYPEAGANHTFSFELLEAILKEFDYRVIVESPLAFAGIGRAISWCMANRLDYFHGEDVYRGWTSGGQLSTLKKGVPESWATGVIHMSAYKLRERLSEAIEDRIVAAYGGRGFPGAWNRLIDTPVTLVDGATTLKTVLKNDILDRVEENAPRWSKLEHARSALLFGPPGTSKTSIVRALAGELGWPYIELNPSHFLRHGLDSIYSRADSIFADLRDLSRVVVLFDEMDALVQRRPAGGGIERLDVTREFLTTSMLPKLAELHDQGRVLFFMATNHQSGFDEAIKRPGRFDLLLHVAPPSWEQKLNNLGALWVGPTQEGDLDIVQTKLQEWIGPTDQLRNSLDIFTYNEMKALLDTFRGGGSLRAAIEADGAESRLRIMVSTWARDFITLREQLGNEDSARAEFENDKRASRRQWS